MPAQLVQSTSPVRWLALLRQGWVGPHGYQLHSLGERAHTCDRTAGRYGPP